MAHKKAKIQKPEKPPKISPLVEVEGRFFQELVNASNQYTALLKQKAQYDFVIKKLSADRKKIQDGKIKLPILITLIPKLMWYMEEDKKEVLKIIDEQLASYNNMVKSLIGQIEIRYEQFAESGVRNREFLAKRFQSAAAKNIVPLRDVATKEEETLFEADFAELLKSEKKQKEFKNAKKEAVKKNVARKTKSKNKK